MSWLIFHSTWTCRADSHLQLAWQQMADGNRSRIGYGLKSLLLIEGKNRRLFESIRSKSLSWKFFAAPLNAGFSKNIRNKFHDRDCYEDFLFCDMCLSMCNSRVCVCVCVCVYSVTRRIKRTWCMNFLYHFIGLWISGLYDKNVRNRNIFVVALEIQ